METKVYKMDTPEEREAWQKAKAQFKAQAKSGLILTDTDIAANTSDVGPDDLLDALQSRTPEVQALLKSEVE